MSIMRAEHRSFEEALVDREWDRLRDDAVQYAEGFYIPEGIQDALPELSRYDRFDDMATPEYIAEWLVSHPEYRGGTSEFVRWNIAARAVWAGMMGGVDMNQEQSQSEKHLIVECLENDGSIRLVPSRKMPQQDLHVDIFSPSELASTVAYWYRSGATERLSGTVLRRDREDWHNVNAHDWPLVSPSLDTGYRGFNFMQDPLPGMRDEDKELALKKSYEAIWTQALCDVYHNVLSSTPYGDWWSKENTGRILQEAADLLGWQLPDKGSGDYRLLLAVVANMNEEEQDTMNPYYYLEDEDGEYGDLEDK